MESDPVLDFAHYTVVWIAPLEIEAQAALYMLDNVHKGHFPMERGDQYLYTAGDVNGHNVIIATLPAEQDYGVGSAAALASQLISRLPNFWFGLLVGVAAGLPNLSRSPPRDIRLGDVLVAFADQESSGIVSYGLGKETLNGFKLLRGGVTAKTDAVVRAAIGYIKLHTPKSGNSFLKFFESMKDKSNSNGTFSDPGQDKDQLYQMVVEDSKTVLQLVKREPREESERTRVWYGRIGSGDKLMKNAEKRDELRDKFDLIGLEMEAAGTVDSIAVGVIRGVCDYGDAQKNKEWQSYAAAVAAAYAKQILCEIMPKRNRRTEALEAQTALDTQSTPKMTDEQIVRFNSFDINGSISQLLGPAAIDMERAQTQIAYNRCNDTGLWLLDDETYSAWFSCEGSPLLFISGIPGCGKTYLLSTLVSQLQKNCSADKSLTYSLMYFFCDSKTESSTRRSHMALVRTITAQILQKIWPINPEFVRSQLETLAQLSKTDEGPIESYFNIILRCLAMVRVNYIVIDALDECDEWRKMLEFFNKLRAVATTQLLFVISAQNTYGIPFAVKGLRQPIFNIAVDSGAQEEDIVRFVKEETEGFDFRDLGKERGVEVLIQGTENSFLLAKLRCETLKRNILPQKGDLETALKNLPEKLNSYYARPLAGLNRTSRYLAQETFGWIMFAKAPLSEAELVAGSESMSLTAPSTMEPPKLSPRGLEYFRLGMIESRQGYLSFAHSTIAEFVSEYKWDNERSLETQKGEIHSNLTQICVNYLSQPSLIEDIFSFRIEREDLVKKWPFLNYATRSWMYHLRLATYKDNTSTRIMEFLQADGGLAWWANLTDQLDDYDWWSLPSVVSQLLEWFHNHLQDSPRSTRLIATTLSEKLVARFEDLGTQIDVSKYVRALILLSSQRTYDNEFEESKRLLDMVEKSSLQLPLEKQIPIRKQALVEKSQILRRQGKFDDAKILCENALSLSVPSNAIGDRENINIKRLLGEIYRDLQLLVLSEEQLRNVFALAEEKLSSSDPDTLLARNALAWTCEEIGKVDEAASLFASEHFELALGKDHPITWSGLNNLAWVFFRQGKTRDAIAILESLLGKRKHTQGKSTAEYTFTGLQLAAAYNSIGRMRDSANLLEELYAEGELYLGEDHWLLLRVRLETVLLQDVELSESAFKEAQELTAEASNLFGLGHMWSLDATARLALMLRYRHKLEEAEEMNRSILASRQKNGDETGPQVLNAMSSLAAILQDRGKLEETETMERDVLQKWKDTGSDENGPDVLHSMSNLAATLLERGKLEEAEAIMQAVLKHWKEMGSDEDGPEILSAMSCLASILQHRRKLKEAETIELAILKARQNSGDMNSSGVLIAMANLASTLRDQNKLEEAEKMQRTVLKAQQVKGNNLGVVDAMENLAPTLQDQNKLEEAEKMQRSVLKSRQETGDNLQVLNAMVNLAATLQRYGKLEEAETMERAVLKSRQEIGDHLKVLNAMTNLASTLRDRGKLEEAEKMQRDVLKARQETGANLEVLNAMANLATTLRSRGKLEEAEKMQRTVLKSRQEIGDNLEVLNAMTGLESILYDRGKLEEAEMIARAVLNAQQETGDHLKVLNAMASLAATLRGRGKLEEAEIMQRDVLKARKETAEKHRVDTYVLQAMADLALILGNRGKLEEAETIQREVLKSRKEMGDENSLDVMNAMESLAITLRRSKKSLEAEKLLIQVTEGRTRQLGRSALGTLSSFTELAHAKWELGKGEEAKAILEVELSLRDQLYQKDYRSLRKLAYNLAIVYDELKEVRKAEELFARALELEEFCFEFSFSEIWNDNRGLLGAKESICSTTELEEFLEREITLYAAETTELSEAKLLSSMLFLGKIKWEQDKFTEAEALEQTVLDRLVARGSVRDSPEVLSTLHSLAFTKISLEKLSEAERLFDEEVHLRRQLGNENHPELLSAEGELAKLRGRQEKPKNRQKGQSAFSRLGWIFRSRKRWSLRRHRS